MAMQGCDSSKIWVTRNGIDPSRFKGKPDKIYGQVIFPSSPDRGLDHALAIMDIVVKEIPEATLQVFYGTDNMRKSGMIAQAEKLEQMLKERPYVKYHGNVQQDELAKHFMDSEVWLYPAHFIETFCITALEAMASKCYPIATNIGALQNTIGQFAELGMADLFDERAETVSVQQKYAGAVIDAIKEQKWRKIDYPIEKLTWESVASEWVKHFEL
jgi:glycosyltransferase involved in cell wall biosynthesis